MRSISRRRVSFSRGVGSDPKRPVAQMRAMKIMIQEIPTRRYYRAAGVWTGDVREASDFRTGSAALEVIQRSKLLNVQLVATDDFKAYQVFPLQRAAYRPRV